MLVYTQSDTAWKCLTILFQKSVSYPFYSGFEGRKLTYSVAKKKKKKSPFYGGEGGEH